MTVSLDELIGGLRLAAFDFDGVFTDNSVYVFEDGREAVRCSRADGLGLQKLRAAGIETVIISTETNAVVSARARKLKVRCLQGLDDKLAALRDFTREMGIELSQTAFVGNDINDLSCLTAVGLPIVVQDAHPDVTACALYQTEKPGGYGAVREVCDLFVRVLNFSHVD